MTSKQQEAWDAHVENARQHPRFVPAGMGGVIEAADAEIKRLRGIVRQVDNCRRALHALVLFCIQIENDPQVSESALKRQNEMDRKDLQISALRAEVDELRRDKALLDWKPITEIHEDCGVCVGININDPGSMEIIHACDIDPDWSSITHFVPVPRLTNEQAKTLIDEAMKGGE